MLCLDGHLLDYSKYRPVSIKLYIINWYFTWFTFVLDLYSVLLKRIIGTAQNNSGEIFPATTIWMVYLIWTCRHTSSKRPFTDTYYLPQILIKLQCTWTLWPLIRQIYKKNHQLSKNNGPSHFFYFGWLDQSNMPYVAIFLLLCLIAQLWVILGVPCCFQFVLLVVKPWFGQKSCIFMKNDVGHTFIKQMKYKFVGNDKKKSLLALLQLHIHFSQHIIMVYNYKSTTSMVWFPRLKICSYSTTAQLR